MSEHVITFAPDGTGRCLWTEAVPLHELGRLEIRRATNIEFNNTTQQWEIRDSENQLLHTDPSRNACLDWEHQYFNR